MSIFNLVYLSYCSPFTCTPVLAFILNISDCGRIYIDSQSTYVIGAAEVGKYAGGKDLRTKKLSNIGKFLLFLEEVF